MRRQRAPAKFVNPQAVGTNPDTDEFRNRWPTVVDMSHIDTVHVMQAMGYTILGKRAEPRPKQAESPLHLDAIGWRNIFTLISAIPETGESLFSAELAYWKHSNETTKFIEPLRNYAIRGGVANWDNGDSLRPIRHLMEFYECAVVEAHQTLIIPNGFDMQAEGFWGHGLETLNHRSVDNYQAIFHVTNMGTVALYGSQSDHVPRQ